MRNNIQKQPVLFFINLQCFQKSRLESRPSNAFKLQSSNLKHNGLDATDKKPKKKKYRKRTEEEKRQKREERKRKEEAAKNS